MDKLKYYYYVFNVNQSFHDCVCESDSEFHIFEVMQNVATDCHVSVNSVVITFFKEISKERLMKQTIDKDGYMTVSLCKNGKARHYRVHRLVAEAFLKNPNNFPFVNHKDENKANNNLDNLGWCSVLYNNHYGKGYCKERFAKQMKSVIQLDLSHNIVCIFPSILEAANAIHGNRNTTSAHIKNKKPYLGYLWA